MPQFDTSTYSSQIFWLFVSLLILITFLKHILIPKLELIFQLRHFRFQDEQKKINNLKNQIDKIKASQEKAIDTAKTDVSNLIQKTRNELEQEKENQIKKINLEIQANIAEFKNQLKWQKQEFAENNKENLVDILNILQNKISKEPFGNKKD